MSGVVHHIQVLAMLVSLQTGWTSTLPLSISSLDDKDLKGNCPGDTAAAHDDY